MSKFGAHVSSGARQGFGEALALCAAAGSPVPVLFAFMQDLWDTVWKYSPTTILIYRTKIRIDGGDYDNPPNMYQADAAAVAEDWYARSRPIWDLNPAHYYAPSNERNPNKNDAAQNSWWAAFDLRLMQLATVDGIPLALHGDSMGTPDYADWQYYHESLAYAKRHGHIITRHEPVEGVDLAFRYRKEHAIIETFAPGLQMAISECYGIGMGHPEPYVDSFQAYDLEAMKDDYLLGFAAYQIGGDETFTPAIPRWASWVATHPTPDNGEPIPMTKIVGVHSRAGGGDLVALDKTTIGLAGTALNGFKFTTQDARNNHAAVNALGIASANCITRLFWTPGNLTAPPTAAQLFDAFRLPIQENIADGILWFEFLNEPNLIAEWKWSAAEFVELAKSTIALIRAAFPKAKIISPGLAPDASTVPTWDAAFASGGLYAACDGIGAHSYGTQPAHLNDDNELRYYRRFASRLTGAQKIWITEASIKWYSITSRTVGLLYGEYANTLEDYVAGVFFFVLQGTDFAVSGEEWTTRQDIARGLAAYVPVTTLYEFQHHHLDGGAAVANKTVQITMNAAHTIVGDYGEVAPPVKKFPLVYSVSPAGAGVVTLNPPQPVDGYTEGTVVTVTFS
jgi:hypothetical protein